MSRVLNTNVDSTVTVKFKDNSVTDGEHLDFSYALADYPSKAEFMVEMLDDLQAAIASDEAINFSFHEIPDNFAKMGLITLNNINEAVWEVLELTDEQIVMLAAWVSIKSFDMGSNEKINVINTLEMAAESFSGNYVSREEWAYNELEDRGIMEKLPKIIENNLMIESIAAEMMQADNVKVVETEAGNFYFKGV